MTIPNDTITAYRLHIAHSRHYERHAFLAGCDDVEAMLDEIQANRLLIEQLSEKIASLREASAQSALF